MKSASSQPKVCRHCAGKVFKQIFERAARLQDALERLTAAIRDVEAELASMKAEHDPFASHIFASRRSYLKSTIQKAVSAAR